MSFAPWMTLLVFNSALATKVWEVSIPKSFAHQPGPKFDKGVFLAWDIDPPLIFVYDSSAKLVMQARLSIPCVGSA